jgi:hypothetical protein
MAQIWLSCYYCLYNDVFHLIHKLNNISTFPFQYLQNCSERSLVSNIAFLILTVLIVFRELVNCVVGQMHVAVVNVS